MTGLEPVLDENPTITPTDPAEVALTVEVSELWQAHTEARTSLRKSQAEMKLIRSKLSQQLYALKQVLARPGRDGGWSSFLEKQHIPRSTGDRLCNAHARRMGATAADSNCTTEQIQASDEAAVRRYFHALWPKLSKVLTTSEAVELFIAELRARAEKAFGPERDAVPVTNVQ